MTSFQKIKINSYSSSSSFSSSSSVWPWGSFSSPVAAWPTLPLQVNVHVPSWQLCVHVCAWWTHPTCSHDALLHVGTAAALLLALAVRQGSYPGSRTASRPPRNPNSEVCLQKTGVDASWSVLETRGTVRRCREQNWPTPTTRVEECLWRQQEQGAGWWGQKTQGFLLLSWNLCQDGWLFPPCSCQKSRIQSKRSHLAPLSVHFLSLLKSRPRNEIHNTCLFFSVLKTSSTMTPKVEVK